MSLTPHHAKYFAHDLTRRAASGMDRLSMSLFDAAVDLNPHQIEAALFALQSPLSKGVILADEVGLGKTIEAGIVLCQFWAERKRRLLVICPASIRKQWALELEEKFNLPVLVLDAKAYREARRSARAPLVAKTVVIMSLNYANSLREEVCVAVIHNKKGIQGDHFSYNHEYAFFCISPGLSETHGTPVPEAQWEYTNLRKWGRESERHSAKNCFYPIFVEQGAIVEFGDVCPDDFHPRTSNIVEGARVAVYPVDVNGTENLETRRTGTQQSLLESAVAQGADGLKEQYLLRYMLDVETRGSQSLLNIQAFTDPTAYKLKVKRPGSDESREVNVDLLETFNWLIGLNVRHIAAPQSFGAEFGRDSEKRLHLKGRLKQNADGPWWFRTVSGTTPYGRKTLVMWRKLTGDPEQDNLVLDEWFTRQGYSAKDSEFGLIYVNGGNNLENLKTPDDTWKVRLIEEDFHRLMFDTEGA